jgi:hypothetical protein
MENLLEECIDLHHKLAEKIKRYEQVIQTFPPIEVINETRYALRAAIEFIVSDPGKKAHATQKLYHALICAYHDLLDGLNVEIVYTLDELKNKKTHYLIQAMGDKRIEINQLIENVSTLIAKARANPAKRFQYYDKDLYENYFESLLQVKKYITEEVLPTIAKIEQESKKEKYQQVALSFFMALFFFILGMIVV